MGKIDETETKVSLLLSQVLGIAFQNCKFDLDGWGKVDNWAKLGNETFLLLEVEARQKHPDTNVVKLWPYLGEHQGRLIFLIQAFFAGSRNVDSSRGKLAEWVAKKLEAEFLDRFAYYKLVIQDQDQISPRDCACLPDKVKAFAANSSG